MGKRCGQPGGLARATAGSFLRGQTPGPVSERHGLPPEPSSSSVHLDRRAERTVVPLGRCLPPPTACQRPPQGGKPDCEEEGDCNV